MKIKAQSLYVLILTIYIICKYIFMYIYSRLVHEDNSYSAAVVFKINALCKHCEQLSIENFWPFDPSWSSHGVCNCIARGRNAFMHLWCRSDQTPDYCEAKNNPGIVETVGESKETENAI